MKQTALWDEQKSKESTTTFTLYEPDAQSMSLITDMLNIYRVQELRPVIQTLKELMPHCVFAGEKRSAKEKRLINLLTNTKTMPKKDLVFVISYFFGITNNFVAYLSAIPKEVRRTWELVMQNYYVSCDRLKQETGQSCIKSRGWYYPEYTLTDPFSLFWVQTHYPTHTTYLCLPKELYTWFSSCFLPTPQAASALETLPADKPYLLFNAEREMSSLTLSMELHYKQSAFTTDNADKLKGATARKLNKTIHAQEFFPKAPDNTAASLRSLLLFSSFCLCRQKSQKAFNWDRPFEEFTIPFRESTLHLVHASMPHLTGLHVRFLSNTGFASKGLQIWEALSAIAEDRKWQDADQFVMRLRCNHPAGSYNVMFLYGGYIRDMEVCTAKLPKRTLSLEEYYTYIGIPFVKAFLFWMAAWGLIEIAYEEFDPQSISYYDTLRYFRFTDLGRYAMGKTKTYRFPNEESKTQFELEEDRLLLRSLHADNPFLAILSNMAEPVGGNRYRMTSSSFLKKCNTLKDIEQQIKLFRQYVAAKPPKIWEDFFTQMQQQATAWKHLAAYSYHLFQLPKGDPQLMRILASDPLLRQYIKRAEDYILLVDALHFIEVQKRLKEYGYLV